MSEETGPRQPTRSPRSDDDMTALLRERPDGWEYLLYGGSLLLLRDAHEGEYRDHLLRYAPLEGEPLDSSAAIQRLEAAFPDALGLVAATMRLFDPRIQERAFGPSGKPGDEALIQQWAQRMIDGYVQLMMWGKGLRAARVPTEFQTAFQLAADMVARPVDEMRAYVDDVVNKMDTVSDLLGRDDEEPVEITITMVLTIDDDSSAAFSRELERVHEALA